MKISIEITAPLFEAIFDIVRTKSIDSLSSSNRKGSILDLFSFHGRIIVEGFGNEF